MVNLRPMRGKVMIKPVKEEKVTKSGIVLPDTVEKEELEQGEVIALGAPKMDDGKEIPSELKVGDRVILKKYGPDKVKIDGAEYMIAEEEDLVGIVQK